MIYFSLFLNVRQHYENVMETLNLFKQIYLENTHILLSGCSNQVTVASHHLLSSTLFLCAYCITTLTSPPYLLASYQNKPKWESFYSYNHSYVTSEENELYREQSTHLNHTVGNDKEVDLIDWNTFLNHCVLQNKKLIMSQKIFNIRQNINSIQSPT